MNTEPPINRPYEFLLSDAEERKHFYQLHSRLYDPKIKPVWNNDDGYWMEIFKYPPPAFTPQVAFRDESGSNVLVLLQENDIVVFFEPTGKFEVQYSARLKGGFVKGFLTNNPEFKRILKDRVLFLNDPS